MGDQNDEIVGVRSLFTYNEKMTLLVIIYEQEGSILPFVNTEFNSQSSIRCHFHGLSDDVHCQIPETKKSSTCFPLLIYNCFKMTACICFETILQNFFFPFPLTIVGGADEVFFQELQLPMTTSRVLSLHILNKISVCCQLQHMQLIYYTFICESLKLTTMKLV